MAIYLTNCHTVKVTKKRICTENILPQIIGVQLPMDLPHHAHHFISNV